MTEHNLPDPKTLRKLLRYDPDTGGLFWLTRDVSFFKTEGTCKMWNKRFAGKPVGEITARGYIRMDILGRRLSAHRVIWAIHHNAWPVDQIDHINGEVADNRIENLREVTNQENNKNRKLPCNNTSGVMGVSWDKGTAKWCAQITVDGKNRHLGRFNRIDEAAAARAKAEIENDFHENHGRT